MSGPLLFLGMATQDFVAVVPRLPGPDEVFEASYVGMHGGGPAATAAVACARLGGRAQLVGALAADAVGETIRAELAREGVGVELLALQPGGVSPASVIVVDGPTGKRSILYAKGQGASLQLSPELTAAVRGAVLLHLDGFHMDAAIAAAEVARAAGVPVSLDGGAGELWPRMEELVPLVNLLVVARDFARRMTGEDDPLCAAQALAKYGASEVVVTDGANGAWFVVAENAHGVKLAPGAAAGEPLSGHVPAFEVPVVDTTGAGDVFHGAYALTRAEGQTVAAAVRFASAVAALKCRSAGGRQGIPARREAEALIAHAR